jgi:hypothetical protein
VVKWGAATGLAGWPFWAACNPGKGPCNSPHSEQNQTMIFAAYASTSQKGRKFVTVSGCLASVARWKTFDSKWHKMLRKESLPNFHMTDFEAYQGHYKDWNKRKA